MINNRGTGATFCTNDENGVPISTKTNEKDLTFYEGRTIIQ